jgi:hypothetical protein
MRSLLAASLLVATCGIFGCGESLPTIPAATKEPTKIGPHQGIAYPLPDGLGFVEIVNEPEVEERGSKVSTSLVVYFLGSDAKVSMTSPPSDVKFNLNPGKPDAKSLVLKAEPKAGDPAGAGRFASETGPYRIEELRGELVATVGGKPVSIPIVEKH